MKPVGIGETRSLDMVKLKKQLSRISERSDNDILIDVDEREQEDPFDANMIIKHLSSISSTKCSPLDENFPILETTKDENESVKLSVEYLAEDSDSPVILRDSSLEELHRNFSLKGLRKKRRRSRVSLPVNLYTSLSKKGSQSSLNSNDSDKYNALNKEWKSVFENLDEKDGRKDGRLHKESLKNILSTLESNSNLSLKYKSGKLSDSIRRQISHADQDKDGFINKDEFAVLITQLDQTREENDKNKEETDLNNVINKHIKTAAYADECRVCPPPFFILITSVLQLAFFVFHVLHLDAEHSQTVGWDGPAPLCSVLIYNPERRYQAWRYISYCLVHSGYSHIVLNLGMQLFVGLPLEMSHGWARVSLVYIFGVGAGSLATSCIDPHVYLAGASGGVYSLIAAHLSNLILNWKEDSLIIRPRLGERAAKATHGTLIRMLKLTAVIAFAVVDTGMAVYSKHMFAHENTTGYTAHIAGALSGLVVGLMVLKNRKVQTWEIWLRLGCVLVTGTFFAVTVLWNSAGDSMYNALYPGQKYFLQPDHLADGNCLFYNATGSF